MSIPFTPTPDMLAVLAEVERNPRSILLRPKATLGAPPTYNEQVTGSEPFMTSAERKLIRAYREEVAEFLYYRGQSILLETNWANARIVDLAEAQLRIKETSVGPSRFQQLSRALAGKSALLRKAVESVDIDRPLECFVLSNRLLPKDSSKIMIGTTHIEMGSYASAEVILSQVLSSASCLGARGTAALNLGLAYWQRKEFAMASALYSWAVHLGPESFQWLGLRLVSQAFVGDWAGVFGTEKQLIARGFDSEHDCVSRTVAQQERGQELARASGNPYVLQKFVPDDLGNLARTILGPYSSDSEKTGAAV